LFVIGNGEYTSTKSDALVMLKNGNITFSGSITSAGTISANGFTGNGSGLTNITIADASLTIAKTNGLQTALDLKANLASPTFTGTPALPTGTTGVTQTASDNSIKLATTAFVTTAVNTTVKTTGDQTIAGKKTFSNDIKAKRYELTAPSAITAASNTTLDLSSGNVLTVNLGANISTLTITNAVVGTYLIKFVQDATGSRTVTFPTAWKWAGGTAPTITATANKIDIVTLIYDGTTYYAAISQNF
jgi:hypothetical protein